MDDRIPIDELEINEDIVYVNNDYGYCIVRDIGYSFFGPITLTLEVSGVGNKLFWTGHIFQKTYNAKKSFRLYQ